MTDPGPVADLVPHAPPMLALDALVEWADGEATATMTVDPSAPYVVDGRVGSAWTLEFMAQSVAACLGRAAFLEGGGVRVGMVVSCRKLSVARPWIPAGTALTLRCRRLRGTDASSQFETSCHDDDGEVARATMTLLHVG